MVVYISLPSSETYTSDFDHELVIKVATECTDKNSHRNSCLLKRSFFSKKNGIDCAVESIVLCTGIYKPATNLPVMFKNLKTCRGPRNICNRGEPGLQTEHFFRFVASLYGANG